MVTDVIAFRDVIEVVKVPVSILITIFCFSTYSAVVLETVTLTVYC